MIIELLMLIVSCESLGGKQQTRIVKVVLLYRSGSLTTAASKYLYAKETPCMIRGKKRPTNCIPTLADSIFPLCELIVILRLVDVSGLLPLIQALCNLLGYYFHMLCAESVVVLFDGHWML